MAATDAAKRTRARGWENAKARKTRNRDTQAGQHAANLALDPSQRPWALARAARKAARAAGRA